MKTGAVEKSREVSKFRRYLIFFSLILALMVFPNLGCRGKKAEEESQPYQREETTVSQGFVVGVLVAFDSPTSEEVLKAFISTLRKYQQETGDKIELRIEKARGELALLPELARKLAGNSQLLVPISTPALQVVMNATEKIPVVFSSVANPYILRAGRTAVDHDPRITGVCSTAPVKQVLNLIKEVKPGERKIGTIWTPSEINSQYYLELMNEAAEELGFELVSTPIDEAADLVSAFQHLMQQHVKIICPVSDNTINANFDQLARLAEENRVPLFAAFALGAELGACASMGFGFADIGKKTAELVIRVKNGESPALIPFQYIDKVLFYINEEASRKQGVSWPPQILKKADGILKTAKKDEERDKG
ncbi:MAG: ABC transporter substrate-binding protein [Candidatus Aminicenantes bacterium]|nr:ABC transporter substrate-binding protein [Candidatus Aminicenantes bacterium]